MPAPIPSRAAVVAYLRSQPKPVHAGQIASEWGIAKASFVEFVEKLDQWVDAGLLRRVGRNRYTAEQAQRASESWTGILSVNPRGFGFVNASSRPDVFVPPQGLAGAMHGDVVRVEVTGKSSRGSEGRVVAVETRRDPRVAGTLRRTRSSVWLEPDDPRLRGPIVIVDGGEQGQDGDAAVVEITRFPSLIDENPQGRLANVLGKSGDANVEVAKILVREQIEEAHPEAAMREAEALAMRTRVLPLGEREDLRAIPFLTIDPADARDHDDAVYVEKLDSGYRVYVAIADVSEYVQAGSALDSEASKRGCTIYLPDRAIPMLPGLLAADACSLLPDCERYCLCVIAELDEQAQPKSHRVVEGLMRAAAMISYDSAARALGFSEAPARSPQAEAFKKELKVLATVAGKTRTARLKRGALDLDLPEPKLVLDVETGVPLSVTQRAKDPGIKRAYQLVEEMMLLANEVVALWLTKRRAPTVYRVHAKPDDEKLERLGNAAEVLNAPFDMEQMVEPLGVSQWLRRIQKHPARAVLEGLLLRSLKQAVYDIQNVGHFGLASSAYLHFTSPIRRYPDLRVHRAVKQLLRGITPERTETALEALRTAATHSSFRERAAMQVEREVVDLYRALFMRDKIGELYEGTITALLGSGLIVAVPDPYVEVMVRFEGLGPDRYELSDDELSLISSRSGERLALGDRMVVEVEDVSLARRTVYARRIAQGESGPRSKEQHNKDRQVRGRGKKQSPEPQRGSAPRGGTPQRGGAPRGGAPQRGKKVASKGQRASAGRSKNKGRR